MAAVETAFWASAALLVYTHVGYPLVLWLLARGRERRRAEPPGELPAVSLIVAAYDEERVIGDKVRNVLSLDYPREKLELIVASDGSSDATVAAARAAGADVVLDLPRGGKVRTQDHAVERASGEVLAFSDANSFWERDALRELVAPFRDPEVGYVCGQVRFVNEEGTNEEGLYWTYEMAVRALESELGGVTAGNGAIYATRRESYIVVDPRMGHDLSFPFNMVKRGWRPVYAPAARAQEKMVPSVEGEFARKRRMMSHAWPIVLRGGLLSPLGYGPVYGFEIASHRVLRYASPFLHLVAFATNVVLLGDGWVYDVTLLAQAVVLVAAALGPILPLRPFRVAYYYVLMTASLAAGLWDYLRTGTPAGWETPEGTR